MQLSNVLKHSPSAANFSDSSGSTTAGALWAVCQMCANQPLVCLQLAASLQWLGW